MTLKKRTETLRGIIAGGVLHARPEHTRIMGEITEAISSLETRNKRRRFLLHVLHLTRAMDTYLAAYLQLRSVPITKRSLGSHLKSLRDASKMSDSERNRYQRNIVDVRNEYMHEAGRYPVTDSEVLRLISEMQSCIVVLP